MQDILSIKTRTNRKNKDKFLSVVDNKLKEMGYKTQHHHFKGLLSSVNLETECENAEYIFIAHYDTATIMPFWMVWLMKLTGINRQLLLIGIMMAFMIPFEFIADSYPIAANAISVIFWLTFLTLFIPTPSNYDDNTSGVITLLELAKSCKEKGIENVKFLFVDNEELGIIGSTAQRQFYEKHNLIPEGCKIISIDCVGGKGEIPLIIRNSNSEYIHQFEEAIKNEFNECKTVKMLLPASDNYAFSKYGALNISFVSKSIIPGGYAINNIHSPADKHIDLEKIRKLCDGIIASI